MFKERLNVQGSKLDYDNLRSEIKRLMSTESIFIDNGTFNLIGCIEECSELIELLIQAKSPREHILEETADVIITSYVLKEFVRTLDDNSDSTSIYNSRQAISTLATYQSMITKVLRGKKDKKVLCEAANAMWNVANYVCRIHCFTEEEINRAINVKLELFRTMKSFK